VVKIATFAKPENVTGDLCRNYAGNSILKISICLRKKFTKQKRENWIGQQKLESWNLKAET
jgi:hypothetical protein